MAEKRTRKKMASKMCDLGANGSDTQKVQSNVTSIYSIYSQGNAKILFVVIFLVHTICGVFFEFWFAGLKIKFSCPKNPSAE